MLTLAKLAAVLRRVPGIAWVIVLVVATIGAAGYGLYHHGLTTGEARVHQVALQDSVHVAEERRDTAIAHSATVLRVADQARHVSEASRADRVAVRQAALAELLDPGLPHLHELVALDDSLSARDSVTIAVQAGAIDTLKAEIATRAQLDRLRVNMIELGAPVPDHHTTAKVIGGALAGVLAVLAILHFGH